MQKSIDVIENPPHILMKYEGKMLDYFFVNI